MKIALLGDIAFFGKHSITNNKKAVLKYFKEAAEFLSKYDIVVGNLETPFFDGDKPYGHKSAHIKADPANVELLKYLNISVVNLANNHIFDYGIEGYRSTLSILEKNGIEYFGIENKQHFVTHENNKIAFSGFCCYSTNALGYYDAKKGYGVNVLNGFDVEKTLVKNNNEGFFNIVSFHWGQEHVNYPNYDHVLLARKLAKRVPYVLYGHHPHVLQGIEEYSGSLLAYSLGNFCFDDVYTDKSNSPLIVQSEINKESVVLILNIQNSEIANHEIISLKALGEKLQVGEDLDIHSKMKEYSAFLSREEDEYKSLRDKEITSYLLNRKSDRNVSWYLKRLNLVSFVRILNASRNQSHYRRAILDYLENNTND
jgi:poly-gamma-glutamate synthesis protein (capsule biosynthesis protein)